MTKRYDMKKLHAKELKKAMGVIRNQGPEAFSEDLSKIMVTSEAWQAGGICWLHEKREGDAFGEFAELGLIAEAAKDSGLMGHRWWNVIGVRLGLWGAANEGDR